MKNKITALRIFPSSLIFLFDLLIVYISAWVALVIRSGIPFLSKVDFNQEYFYIPLIFVAVYIPIFLIFKIHRIIVRYTNTKDVFNVMVTGVVAIVALLLLDGISYAVVGKFLIPISIIITQFVMAIIGLIFYRISAKMIYLRAINPTKYKRNIVIIGAGEAGIITKQVLDRDAGSKYEVLAFFDDDPSKKNKKLSNVPIFDMEALSDYLQQHDVAFLIIAIQNFSTEKRKRIAEIAMQHNVKVLLVPPVTRWINGELSFKQIKKVKIEDLLERDQVFLDTDLISKELCGKTVLITGAAGSIGREIVRQVMQYACQRLILIDNAETPVFYLYNECLSQQTFKNLSIRIETICDKVKMEQIFAEVRPDIIYHAAAYKHVPMMEENPGSAVKTNVEGTKIIADLAVKYGVQKFVMVSTDKAVNPTNVMGASKRIAEIYVQSLNFKQHTTKFITTRFGNVLGTNGSVIPIFKKQIENGGPVQVTHPDITRFFMTIPEACQLVIHAGAMGNGGEIFIFDMGESVKIYDLAVKMIKLSGLTLGKDIQIVFTGLRPGEKLYEELLANKENTIETPNPKIMIAKVRSYDYDSVSLLIDELIAMKNDDAFAIVKKMKDIVPEFISKNSPFEVNNRMLEESK